MKEFSKKSDLGHHWVKLDQGHGSTDRHWRKFAEIFNPLLWMIGGRDDSSVDLNELIIDFFLLSVSLVINYWSTRCSIEYSKTKEGWESKITLFITTITQRDNINSQPFLASSDPTEENSSSPRDIDSSMNSRYLWTPDLNSTPINEDDIRSRVSPTFWQFKALIGDRNRLSSIGFSARWSKVVVSSSAWARWCSLSFQRT